MSDPDAMPILATLQPLVPAINHAIASAFGVSLIGDVAERLSRARITLPPGAKRRDAIQAIRDAGILFVHVPKVAGTSISRRLYDTQVRHGSTQYYARVAPDLLALPSFAVVRDPVDRFRSAYAYARKGGTIERRVAAPFRRRYLDFRSVDDAIDHLLSAQSVYDVDHIFRPQSWYLCDGEGTVAVDRLVPYERIDELGDLLGIAALRDLPRLNCGSAATCRLTSAQAGAINAFYTRDRGLVEQARDRTRRPMRPLPPPAIRRFVTASR